MKSVGEYNMLCSTRCILHLNVNGNGIILCYYSRHLLPLHVTSSALLMLRRSRCILHLRVVSGNKFEVLQLAAIFLDLSEPCMRSRLVHGVCLFFGIFRLMRETKRAVLPPVFGRIITAPATSLGVSNGGLVAATPPACTLRVSSAVFLRVSSRSS